MPLARCVNAIILFALNSAPVAAAGNAEEAVSPSGERRLCNKTLIGPPRREKPAAASLSLDLHAASLPEGGAFTHYVRTIEYLRRETVLLIQ